MELSHITVYFSNMAAPFLSNMITIFISVELLKFRDDNFIHFDFVRKRQPSAPISPLYKLTTLRFSALILES